MMDKLMAGAASFPGALKKGQQVEGVDKDRRHFRGSPCR